MSSGFWDALSGETRKWGAGLADLLFPPACPVCGRLLVKGEGPLCLHCLLGLPKTNWHNLPLDNPVAEIMLANRVKIERVTSYFHYDRHSSYANIIRKAKYNGRPDLLRLVAHDFAGDISPSGFFAGVDYLLPVPMHWFKQFRRGFNQAEEICKGLTEATGVPTLYNELVALRPHHVQALKSASERSQNVQGLFGIADPGVIAGRHVMVVDDVITTGSTIISCVKAIHTASPTTRVSVISLAAVPT